LFDTAREGRRREKVEIPWGGGERSERYGRME
jgi:hypothetical protein